MRPRMVWLLDKGDPPAESFIDGMLAHDLPASGAARVLLVTSRGAGAARPRRYGRAVCLPVLGPRRGVSRFLNLPRVWALVRRLRRRAAARGARLVLAPRNEPVHLLGAALARGPDTPVVFQQTFPHERQGRNAIKKGVARLLMAAARRRVDGLLAVSPLGLERLRGYFPAGLPGDVIPLLAARSERVAAVPPEPAARPLQVVYTGSHRADRRLETVLAGIVRAVGEGAALQAHFIGATPAEAERLRRVPGVEALIASGHLRLRPPMPRPELVAALPAFDLGLSLIPPTPIFREASPTKLTEYLGAALPVLASEGIPLQETITRDSGAGTLVPFDTAAITRALHQHATESPEQRHQRRHNALDHARTHLDYTTHLPALTRWL